jgi:prevent-host-death family protein
MAICPDFAGIVERGTIMEKAVGAFEARRSFGRLLQDVATRGDRVVVERHGEPVAAVIPIDVYNQWKRSRADFFERMRQASERAALTPEEADTLAAEAVAAIRSSPPE